MRSVIASPAFLLFAAAAMLSIMAEPHLTSGLLRAGIELNIWGIDNHDLMLLVIRTMPAVIGIGLIPLACLALRKSAVFTVVYLIILGSFFGVSALHWLLPGALFDQFRMILVLTLAMYPLSILVTAFPIILARKA